MRTSSSMFVKKKKVVGKILTPTFTAGIRGLPHEAQKMVIKLPNSVISSAKEC